MILHIARLRGNLTNGVNVVVPKHVSEQSAYARVGLVNISDAVICDPFLLPYCGSKNFPDYLPAPFDRPDIVVFPEVNNFEYVRLYKPATPTRA